MRILLLTLTYPLKNDQRNLYSDLVAELVENGNDVAVIGPLERRNREVILSEKFKNLQIYRVKTLNVTSTRNFIEKGIGIILFPYQIIRKINQIFKNERPDIVLYATPPVTFASAIKYLKKKYHTKTFLMLKDIFPHNAVDMGILKQSSLIWKYFRKEEKKLYQYSDKIGCLSPANIAFVKRNNPYIDDKKLVEFPNSTKVRNNSFNIDDRFQIRTKYKIPPNKIVMIYGGNLGVPQGVDFLLEIINSTKAYENFHIIVAGKGTEYSKLQSYIQLNKFTHISLFDYLPTEDFDKLVCGCDIGLLLLDRKFSMPNFPSRLLPYLDAGIPVLSATDTCTDVGIIIEEYKCGYSIVHGDIESFQIKLKKILEDSALRKNMGLNSKKLLLEKYTTAQSYKIIMKAFN